MQQFTIRDIENLTGIKAHTLRIWEQRYNFFSPQRKESLHRFYDNDDLKKLLRIAYLYHNGWKVSKIAELNEVQIVDTVRKMDAENSTTTAFVSKLIEAAVDFDEHRFLVLLNEMIGKIGFEKSVTEVCYPFLQKVGLLWSTNNVLPAQEHFSSYIIQNKIISETEKVVLEKKHTHPQIVLYAPKGEYHELPLLFINYLLKKNDQGTIYLGPNIDLPLLDSITTLGSIKYIYLHLITNFTGFFIDDYLEEACKRFPNKTIIASGVEILKAQRQFTNLVLLKSDEDIYNFVRNGISL
jgi:MerR family transcriptional regulator, light-induced transcriptional regulator